MTRPVPLKERLRREEGHGAEILRTHEENWGWNTPAGAIRKDRRARFLAAPAAPGAHVLEVGCGTGTFTGELAKAFPDLTCIDISGALLERAAQAHPGVAFRKEDIHRTTFPDGSFDLAVGCSVLHHLDWDLALREIHRILAPGGELRFSEPNLLNPQIFLQKKWPWLKRRMGDSPDESAFTPRQIERSLAAAGFTDVSAQPFEFLHPATPKPLIGAVIGIESVIERTFLVRIAGSIRIRAKRG